MNDGSVSDKSSLDSLVADTKRIVKLAHDHAKVCESFRNVLKENEAGHHPTPVEPETANPDFAGSKKRDSYLNG